jgi:cell wall assembly regulator SMI1
MLTRDIIAWLRDHAPEHALVLLKPGATDAELAAIKRHLGHDLPLALQAMLRVANGDLYIGEYAQLSTESIAYTWNVGKELLGTDTSLK